MPWHSNHIRTITAVLQHYLQTVEQSAYAMQFSNFNTVGSYTENSSKSQDCQKFGARVRNGAFGLGQYRVSRVILKASVSHCLFTFVNTTGTNVDIKHALL